RPRGAGRGSRLPTVRLQSRADRLLVEELGEPLLMAALAVDELRLLELRVEVVLCRVPAHGLRMLEAELRGAQHDRVLCQQLARQRLHLVAQPLAANAPVDEPHLSRLAPVERAARHHVEEGVANADGLGEAAAHQAPWWNSPVDLREAERGLVGGDR